MGKTSERIDENDEPYDAVFLFGNSLVRDNDELEKKHAGVNEKAPKEEARKNINERYTREPEKPTK